LLRRPNWLRDQELHLATPAYEAGLTLGLPASEFWQPPWVTIPPVPGSPPGLARL